MMGMRNFKTVDSSTEPDAKIELVEETLSDGSKAYSVMVGRFEVECVSPEAASDLFSLLLDGTKYSPVYHGPA